MTRVKYNLFLWSGLFLTKDQLSDPVHHTAPNSHVGTARGTVWWRWGVFELAIATQSNRSGNTGLALEEKMGLILSGHGIISCCRCNENVVTWCFVKPLEIKLQGIFYMSQGQGFPQNKGESTVVCNKYNYLE